MITCGEGKYRVWLKRDELGESLVYTLGGGESSHVGAVAVKVPGQGTKVVKLEGHYDHIVLEPIAEAAALKYGRTVVALGGIHIDDASKFDIELLVSNCKELIKCI